MSRSNLEDFERRLKDRRARHRRERAEVSAELFETEKPTPPPCPSFDGLPFEEAIAAYDGWIEERRRARSGDPVPGAEPAAEPAAPPPSAQAPSEPERRRGGNQGRLQPIRSLSEIDGLVASTFALNKFLPNWQVDFPAIVSCPTPQALTDPLGKALPNYRQALPGWVEEARAHPGQVRPGNPLSYPALHLHKRGTYVNTWQIAGGRARDLDALLEEPDSLTRVLTAVAVERWGYGFIECDTEWGKDLHAAGLGAYRLARRLGLSISASPAAAQEAVMSESALFATKGWALWIGEYLVRQTQALRASSSKQEGRLRLSQLWDAVKRLFRVVPLEIWTVILGVPIPGLDQFAQAVSETLSWLLLNTSLDARITNWHMRRMQRLALGVKPYEAQLGGISIENMLSRILLSKVEAHLGAMLVPYAVLLAANLDFSARSDAEEIRQWLDADVWQNVDARLLMLTKLDRSVRHNVTTLMSTAVHELGLAPLEGMQWT